MWVGWRAGVPVCIFSVGYVSLIVYLKTVLMSLLSTLNDIINIK
jgi:hypothetical protein